MSTTKELLVLLREALLEDFSMCVAELAKARGRLEAIATGNEDRRIAASLGSTCDYLRSRWFIAETRIDAALAASDKADKGFRAVKPTSPEHAAVLQDLARRIDDE